MTIFDDIRSSCAAVAEHARFVTIDRGRVAGFAAEIDLDGPQNDPGQARMGSEESATAFVLALDAINFGSGYFPHLHKRPGMSGYHTIATSLRDLVADTGALTADRLARWTIDDAAATFQQTLDGGPAHELMQLFITAWHDLAAWVERHGDGSFAAAVAKADGSAATLVTMLDEMPFFHDVHTHPAAGEVLLYKRAQITVQDLAVAFDGDGPGRFTDRSELTMFPDNLVPHVLRVEGVLHLDDELVARIEAVEDIAVGSPEEVEIRACGLHAVELLRDELAAEGTRITSGDLDNVLWNLGAGPRYKAVPRHRCRCVFY
ncbi:MAG: queuosine salvage family protein [Acidimicrobiales bacterium]|nr:queuosine salvage family protein [Acidimicrobiales bacterium]